MFFESILNFVAYLFIFRQLVRFANLILDFVLPPPDLMKRYG
jgi:hypothetical protein